MDSSPVANLSIGALARATGISANTIRTWERRHRVLQPSRDARGQRRYCGEDVARLKAIAELVRHGDRVADLAELTLAELRSRRDLLVTSVRAPRALHVGVYNDETLAAGLGATDFRVTLISGPTTPRLDGVVVHLDALQPNPAAAAERILNRHQSTLVFVLGHLVPRDVRVLLQERGIQLVRRDLSYEDLRKLIVDTLARENGGPTEEADQAAPPQFSSEQLQRILNLPTDLDCECPNHLAGLVIALRGFEDYSLQCIASAPGDAPLHSMLAEETGHAREIIERLLSAVCAHEQIVP